MTKFRLPDFARLLIVAWVVLAGGCVEIEGGAVEVSWAIFARDGRGITDCSCASPSISYVRLNLVSVADPGQQPCAGLDACRFTCHRKTGATPFVVPPGQYLMSVVPVDAAGNDLPTVFAAGDPTGPAVPWVQTPPATTRTVVRGRPTALEAFDLEVDCACQRNGVCTAE
ncbi:MAG: hypothetical protein H7X95_00655 [Deltaproteobacteria bacterium]|nr:hypothetical protein [Deltaproteobacteria bacterium]